MSARKENIMNWIVFVITALIFSVLFNQFYKISTKNMKNAGALTILIELLAALLCTIYLPFFKFKLPSELRVYLFLGLSIIFYTMSDRLGTTVRSGMEASSYNIIGQLSTVFMIFAGILFFKEELVISKLVGAFLIIVSNVLVFYKKGSFKIDKYIGLGIVANLCLATALLIDVNNSEQFSLPFYVMITLSVPTILIFIFERIKIKDIKNEFKLVNKKALFITSFSWATMIISQLRAYQLGSVTVVAPLLSVSAILNVIIGYLFLNEKDNLFRKILAAILVIISVILIKI